MAAGGEQVSLISELRPLASKWKSLGLYLGFTQGEIDEINADVNGMDSRTEHCFPKVLEAWLEGRGRPKTKEVLVEALRKIGYSTLAETIESRADFRLELGPLCEALGETKAKYFQLGVFLGLNQGVIKEFEKYSGDSALCLTQLLHKLATDRSPINLETVYKAVDLVGYPNLAKELKDKYGVLPTTTVPDHL